MLDAPIGFAFAAGVVAAFNPCGFALLPAYLSYFLGTDDDDIVGGAAGGGGAVRVASALRVAAAVSVGFAFVFGIAGFAITQLSITVQRFTPWLSIAIGLALVPMGVAMARGWQPKIALPRLARSGRLGIAGNDRGLAAMAGFGASYATVSLSCTIPAFLVAVASTFEQADAASGLAAFGAYTAGMAMVLGTLTVAVALAQGALVRRLRRVLPHVQKAAGALLAIAGAYVAYYGYYDIRLAQGRSVPSGPVDAVGRWSGSVTRWVDGLGNGPVLAAGAGLLVVAAFLIARRRRGHRSDDELPGPTSAVVTLPGRAVGGSEAPARHHSGGPGRRKIGGRGRRESGRTG